MQLKIETVIQNSYQDVFRRFNLQLFSALKPPLTSIHVYRFDGCRTGDEVHLDVFLLGIFRQHWKNKIVSEEHTDQYSSFTDIGLQIPFPLKTWKHIHTVRNLSESTSVIVDHIFFTTGLSVLDLCLYPLIYLMFKAREPVYIRELT